MRKAKVITSLALTAVILVATTGLAAAESVKPGSGEYNYDIPNDGTPVTVTLKIAGFKQGWWTPGQTHTIKATTTWAGNGGLTTDLRYKFTNETSAEYSSWLKSGDTFQWTDNSEPDYVTLEIKTVSSPPLDAKYNIRIDDNWDLGGGRLDVGACTIGVESIPEFTTIAIPVATILGLLLFFNYRKQKIGKRK